MAGQDRATKDKEMAADLKRRGIYPGMRPNSTLADPKQYLKPDLVGTARYRRYLLTIREGNTETRQRKNRLRQGGGDNT